MTLPLLLFDKVGKDAFFLFFQKYCVSSCLYKPFL